jgi:tRNA(adenine34) deaminase
MIDPFDDTYFMKQAFQEAQKAYALGEIPVGAVIVAKNQIIARAHNLTQQLNDVTAHAEMLCITAAANHLGAKYLHECTLYITLEPCCMCAGALYWSQIDKIVYAARDEKRGACSHSPSLFHPKTLITNGIMEKECGELLRDFFEKKRVR